MVPMKQMSTAAIEYLSGCMTGQALLSMVVCMSTATQNGWETWFSCTYGEDLAKLRAPVKPRVQKDIAKYVKATAKDAKEKEKAHANTKTTGPSAKYVLPRKNAAFDAAQEAALAASLAGGVGAGDK
mmetsp:Transcript_27677/g.64523  ORF Transcript_27677/g.64523 Transcript_27677/m.64523 type:complete len:127 (-) Transcript_27677:37-417(-)